NLRYFHYHPSLILIVLRHLLNLFFSGIVIVYSPWLFALLSAVVPSGNVTVTVEPGSAVPLTVVASLVTSFTVGASGAVASTTIVEASVDLLLDLSCAIA